MIEQVSFTVDAGIINRLGLELVSKSETAVAELIKNAYDADANIVKVAFEGAKQIGGKLIIDDDGVGMTRNQLTNGFMRLATSDKIHNSVSPIYKRPKAGRKGIGRFSTQRLGKKLIIITQTEDSLSALKLTIDWDNYETDKEIHEIKNNLELSERIKDKKSGTRLIIDSLRDSWSEADIKRVYRYCSELIQPNFLKIEKEGALVEESKKESFEAQFLARDNVKEEWKVIADPQTMMFNRAIAVLSGYIDENGFGYCTVKTREFSIGGKKQNINEKIPVSNVDKENKNQTLPFLLVKGSKIAFQIYYFIANRIGYYSINSMELNAVIKHVKDNGGLKLYRNGFRVARYGDKGNDWADIEKNSRIAHPLPFGNGNILGLVQVTDAEGKVFDEAAGREGLIEKEAFYEMQKFISSAIVQAFKRFASWFPLTDEYKLANPDKDVPTTTSSASEIAKDLNSAAQTLSNPDSTEEQKTQAAIVVQQSTKKLISQAKAVVDELEMLRVLAGVGLTIAEFIHEVKQFIPSLSGYIEDLLRQNISESIKQDLRKMEKVIVSFLSYTAYFDSAISQNIVRELKPIDISYAVEQFKNVVHSDIQRRNFLLEIDDRVKNVITIPMHPSEWNTILQNLYSNAKKAIIRANRPKGKILISFNKDKVKGLVTLSFYDNGNGILEEDKGRIFDAFFTTSTPILNQNDITNDSTGTGLGLYIIKQIVNNRKGKIWVDTPIGEYKTCITIQLPLITSNQLEQYGS